MTRGPQSRLRLRLWLGILGAVVVSSVLSMHAVAGDRAAKTVASLLRLANGPDPAARLSASRELFRRGAGILPELVRAGAKPMTTLSPQRGDVIYSLLNGLLSARRTAPDSFGLHVDANVTERDIQRIGLARGFQLTPYSECRQDTSPTCYVHLRPGKTLAPVLKDILMNEPRVKTVNLNYVER